MTKSSDPLHIVSLSLHGLVRSSSIELGHDADTGGQIEYVVQHARALVQDPRVESVEVVTRCIEDRRIDRIYSNPRERICEGAEIVRLPFGPRRYLSKERLWPYLDGLADRLVRHLRENPWRPDIIHGHYADAGYVGAQVADLLGVPFVFTGHSLGRVKRARLMEKGLSEETINRRYNIDKRIEAEERALVSASLIVTSTSQEVEEQYELYDHYVPERMEVIPPGVDLNRFSPPGSDGLETSIAAELKRFLRHPDRPAILALSRPDERKNLANLVRAYAETAGLRDQANLILIAGTRDDVSELPRSQRRVLVELLRLIDKHDLYGLVAYPKHHRSEDVPDLYRFAAATRGAFVNVALTEPFGLTLLEAAATGLPVVATRDGGPRDILAQCRNGRLVDPLDISAIGQALLEVTGNERLWKEYSENAVAGVEKYTWTAHARRYLGEVERLRAGVRPSPPIDATSRLSAMDRLLVTDVDDALIGDDDGLTALKQAMKSTDVAVGLAVSTGRTRATIMDVIESGRIPRPDILIASNGTEIYYGRSLTQDRFWTRHIDFAWKPEEIDEAILKIPGITPQAAEHQSAWKRSFRLPEEYAPDVRHILVALRRGKLRARVIVSHLTFLDVVPIRASAGQALRFVALKWKLPPERLLVCGASGKDLDMLSGDTLGVVIGNHTPELEQLRNMPRVYFSESAHARGILDGIEHYSFLGDVRIPGEDESGEQEPDAAEPVSIERPQ